MSHVLVAYVSHSGSTGEMAEHIGRELRTLGHEVDVISASDVKEMVAYDAVIAGALLYRFGWHPDMVGFLERYRSVLQNKPTWLFVTGLRYAVEDDAAGMPCPLHIDPGASGNRSDGALIGALRNALPLIESIGPRSLAYFRGKIDMAVLSTAEKAILWILLRVMRRSAGDYRNWEGLSSWVRSLDIP